MTNVSGDKWIQSLYFSCLSLVSKWEAMHITTKDLTLTHEAKIREFIKSHLVHKEILIHNVLQGPLQHNRQQRLLHFEVFDII